MSLFIHQLYIYSTISLPILYYCAASYVEPVAAECVTDNCKEQEARRKLLDMQREKKMREMTAHYLKKDNAQGDGSVSDFELDLQSKTRRGRPIIGRKGRAPIDVSIRSTKAWSQIEETKERVNAMKERMDKIPRNIEIDSHGRIQLRED